MATPGGLEHEQLFSDVTALVREYLIKYQERSSKVCIQLQCTLFSATRDILGLRHLGAYMYVL